MGTFDALGPESFARLGLALLKREISPAVRRVAGRGPDGGRDAILDGPCTTSRYDWDGLWIFQFKHYAGEVQKARRLVLADYEREATEVSRRYGSHLRNYLMVTSVPFTGTPERGLFDRFAALSRELADTLAIAHFELWDGLELEDLLIQHPSVGAYFFPRAFPVPSNGLGGGPRSPGLGSDRMLSGGDEELVWAMESALGRGVWVMAPGANTTFWNSYLHEDQAALHGRLVRTLRQLKRIGRDHQDARLSRIIGWTAVLAALAAARIGRPLEAIRLAGGWAVEAGRALDAELAAWAWNVLSMAYGKLDQEARHSYATEQAIAAARACGAEWLARTVELRAIHKLDWAANERTTPVDSSVFEARIREIGDHDAAALSGGEREHLRAQEDAYLALHFTWDEASQDQADRSIRSAESRFADLGDEAELGRLKTESGRLLLGAGLEFETALADLRAGLAQRVRSGELPRVRYDLLYLGEALCKHDSRLRGELCMWSALSIHRELYGTRDVDRGFVDRLVAALDDGSSELQDLSGRRRLEIGLLAEMLVEATGLNEVDLTSAVRLSDLRRMIALRDRGMGLRGAGRS